MVLYKRKYAAHQFVLYSTLSYLDVIRENFIFSLPGRPSKSVCARSYLDLAAAYSASARVLDTIPNAMLILGDLSNNVPKPRGDQKVIFDTTLTKFPRKLPQELTLISLPTWRALTRPNIPPPL